MVVFFQTTQTTDPETIIKNMNSFSIILRDLQVPTGQPVKFLVEELIKSSQEDENDYIGDDVITATVDKFVGSVRAGSFPLTRGNHDIYISIYGEQGDILLPHSFFVLVAETGLKVTIDFNS